MDLNLESARPVIRKSLEIIATVREAIEPPSRIYDWRDYWSAWRLDNYILEFTELCDGPQILVIGFDSEWNKLRYYGLDRCVLHYDISSGYEDFLEESEPYEKVFIYQRGEWEEKIHQLYDRIPPEQWKDRLQFITDSYSGD